MSEILNCIIFYDNYEEVASYVLQLEEQNLNEKIKLAITVNRDTEGRAKLLSSSQIDINLFFPNENLGYLNGLFYSYESFLREGLSIKWVVFSNTDIEIPDKNFFEKLLASDYSEDVFCIAPSIFEKNRKVYENPQYYERYTSKSIKRRIFIFSHPILSKYYLALSQVKSSLSRKKKKNSSYVYSAHGSFFILKPKFLNELERNYMSLMYSEEAFIAEEIRLSNGKVYYDDTLEVIHNESQTTSKIDFKQKSNYISESLLKIYNQYFNEDFI